jgi:PIN domain nuclease of toxin-antitoxin system
LKILLDTNALVWSLTHEDGGSLGELAKRAIQGADCVYVSSISVVEIRVKSMLGKIVSHEGLLADVEEAGFVNLSFEAIHADAILNFPELARHDPFDRMLLAQASVEQLRFLTSDTILLSLSLPFTLNARE